MTIRYTTIQMASLVVAHNCMYLNIFTPPTTLTCSEESQLLSLDYTYRATHNEINQEVNTRMYDKVPDLASRVGVKYS